MAERGRDGGAPAREEVVVQVILETAQVEDAEAAEHAVPLPVDLIPLFEDLRSKGQLENQRLQQNW